MIFDGAVDLVAYLLVDLLQVFPSMRSLAAMVRVIFLQVDKRVVME